MNEEDLIGYSTPSGGEIDRPKATPNQQQRTSAMPLEAIRNEVVLPSIEAPLEDETALSCSAFEVLEVSFPTDHANQKDFIRQLLRNLSNEIDHFISLITTLSTTADELRPILSSIVNINKAYRSAVSTLKGLERNHLAWLREVMAQSSLPVETRRQCVRHHEFITAGYRKTTRTAEFVTKQWWPYLTKRTGEELQPIMVQIGRMLVFWKVTSWGAKTPVSILSRDLLVQSWKAAVLGKTEGVFDYEGWSSEG